MLSYGDVFVKVLFPKVCRQTPTFKYLSPLINLYFSKSLSTRPLCRPIAYLTRDMRHNVHPL